jgi:hypothetical protein
MCEKGEVCVDGKMAVEYLNGLQDRWVAAFGNKLFGATVTHMVHSGVSFDLMFRQMREHNRPESPMAAMMHDMRLNEAHEQQSHVLLEMRMRVIRQIFDELNIPNSKRREHGLLIVEALAADLVYDPKDVDMKQYEEKDWGPDGVLTNLLSGVNITRNEEAWEEKRKQRMDDIKGELAQELASVLGGLGLGRRPRREGPKAH